MRISCVLILLVATALAGCATGGQTGALAGGGIGALAGQAIGGDTEATLIGAAVGTGIGYLIGNEADKKKAAEMSKESESRSYSHAETSPLAGTRWKVVSLVPRDIVPPFREKIVEFRSNGLVTTTTTAMDGTVDIADEHYRVVGTTLIVNKPGYIINARYGLSGNQLIVDAETFRAVLEKA
jgi:hypothetical protein